MKVKWSLNYQKREVQTRTAQLLVCIVASEEEGEPNATQLPTVIGPRSKNAATTTAAWTKLHILNRIVMKFGHNLSIRKGEVTNSEFGLSLYGIRDPKLLMAQSNCHFDRGAFESEEWRLVMCYLCFFFWEFYIHRNDIVDSFWERTRRLLLLLFFFSLFFFLPQFFSYCSGYSFLETLKDISI